jgi:hypothetical protein
MLIIEQEHVRTGTSVRTRTQTHVDYWTGTRENRYNFQNTDTQTRVDYWTGTSENRYEFH